jgi:hypothetical protein
MSAQPLVPPVAPPASPRSLVRVEYVDFQDVAEHREFRFRMRGLDVLSEVRVRIALTAFAACRVRLQDGPDVSYQKLVRTAAADPVVPEVIALEDVDLRSYAEAHTNAPKHRSWSSSTPSPELVAAPEGSALPSSARAFASVPEPLRQGGQRVNHAVFGLGVMSSPSAGHTVVCFDQDGPRRFITSMLEVDILSAPQTWETSPRGKNRLVPPRRAV